MIYFAALPDCNWVDTGINKYCAARQYMRIYVQISEMQFLQCYVLCHLRYLRFNVVDI